MYHDKRPLTQEDILFPPTLPPHYDITDASWAATYEWWEREWTNWEDLLPKGGFLEDFVLATKGTETATSFAMWTALTVVATVTARHAYLSLHPVSWYPNLYVILVAPPGLAKKGTALNYGERLLRRYHEYIQDPNLRWLKAPNIHTNRVTPEGIQDLMKPPAKSLSKREDITDILMDKGSQLALFVGELSTFLGRQSYNLGMVAKLTDLYEGKANDVDYTKKDGKQDLRDIFINFLAATTPGDMEKVIPEEAFGGGLMSRTVVVYEEMTHRHHPLPIAITGGPSHEDLMQGLAWIAANSYGPYELTREARAFYYQWYEKFKRRLQRDDAGKVLSQSRMDVILIKLAILIRAQRYEMGRDITLKDIVKAEQILHQTYTNNEKATEDVGATDRGRNYHRVLKHLQRHRVVNRRKILQTYSRNLSSEDLSSILDQLREAGHIDVYEDGRLTNTITRSSKQTYHYVEGGGDG